MLIKSFCGFVALSVLLSAPVYGDGTFGPGPFDPAITDNAAEIFPDRDGFVVVRSFPEDPLTMSNVAIRPFDHDGVVNETRASTREIGTRNSSGPFAYTWTIDLLELLAPASGALTCIVQNTRNASEQPGSSEDITTRFFDQPVEGHSNYFSGLQGERTSYTNEYHGIRFRGAEGGINYLTERDYHYFGDFVNGIPSSQTNTLFLLERSGPGTVWTDTNLPVSSIGGPTLQSDAKVVAITDLGGSWNLWRMTTPTVTVSSLGIPASPTPTLLSCAENSTGELVVLYQAGGRLKAWSTANGSSDLTPSASTISHSYCWFDQTGSFHAWVGNVPTDTSCPTHLWRSSGGTWETTDLCSLLATATIKRLSFDMTKLDDLRVAVACTDNGQDQVRLLQFDEGIWTTSLLDTAVDGGTFEDLNAGGIANDGYLVVYRHVLPERDTLPGEWTYFQEGGDLPAFASSWQLFN